MLGMPCFSADHASIDALQSLIEREPADGDRRAASTPGVVTAGSLTIEATLPPALRDGFLSGQWNPTAMLLDQFDEVRAVACAAAVRLWILTADSGLPARRPGRAEPGAWSPTPELSA